LRAGTSPTAIEGSSLSEQDVVAVVERDEARGSLLEALEVRAYADAAGWVYETAPGAGIDLGTVREVHRRVVGPGVDAVRALRPR
jgi:hypothetical protein